MLIPNTYARHVSGTIIIKVCVTRGLHCINNGGGGRGGWLDASPVVEHELTRVSEVTPVLTKNLDEHKAAAAGGFGGGGGGA